VREALASHCLERLKAVSSETRSMRLVLQQLANHVSRGPSSPRALGLYEIESLPAGQR